MVLNCGTVVSDLIPLPLHRSVVRFGSQDSVVKHRVVLAFSGLSVIQVKITTLGSKVCHVSALFSIVVCRFNIFVLLKKKNVHTKDCIIYTAFQALHPDLFPEQATSVIHPFLNTIYFCHASTC